MSIINHMKRKTLVAKRKFSERKDNNINTNIKFEANQLKESSTVTDSLQHKKESDIFKVIKNTETVEIVTDKEKTDNLTDAEAKSEIIRDAPQYQSCQDSETTLWFNKPQSKRKRDYRSENNRYFTGTRCFAVRDYRQFKGGKDNNTNVKKSLLLDQKVRGHKTKDSSRTKSNYDVQVWKEKYQAVSSVCLTQLDQKFRVLEQKEREMQLHTLLQKEKTRQEFISFHELLIEEEKNILEHLEKSFQNYLLQNMDFRQTHCSLIEEEARLMCESLSLTDDHKVVDLHIDKKWTELLKKTNDVFAPLPTIMPYKFSLRDQKIMLKSQLSTVLEPVDIVPVSFTLYLDETDLIAPIQVSDIFTCKNSQFANMQVKLEIRIRCGKAQIWRGIIHMHDFLFNFGDKPHLEEYQRYVVTARPLNFCDYESSSGKKCKNILLVTGRKKLMKEVEDEVMQYIVNVRDESTPSDGLFGDNYEQYDKWTSSKMWKYSSFSTSKGFYNVSPEELRTIAYTTNNVFYNKCLSLLNEDFRKHCSHQNEELVKFFEAVSMELEETQT